MPGVKTRPCWPTCAGRGRTPWAAGRWTWRWASGRARRVPGSPKGAAAVADRSIARLWRTQSVVGPGGACTRAAHRFLRTGDWASCGAPAGQAGNGTAMRTAVLGLFFLRDPHRLAEVVADVSRITHQDPRSVA